MSTLTGLGASLRITLRRSWLFWLLWIAGLALLMPATASQYDTIIPSGTDPRATLEPLLHNPTMMAILGPAFNLYDKGGFIFWRVGGFTSMAAGLMGGFGIIRATRAEEEAGRIELVRSGPVGRHAPLTAGLFISLGGCLLLGAINAAALIGLGLAPAGSLAAGLAIFLTGALFVGFGAVAAQIFESGRSARSWTLGIGLGGMYLLRAIIDGNSNDAVARLRWLIPLEWGMLARPFADERWWVFVLPAGLTAVMIGLAFVGESRRDHGAGLRQAGLGRAEAPAQLGGAWGLAWRLQRGGLVGWALSLLGSAVAFGSIASNMGSAFTSNPQLGVILQRMGGTTQLEMAFYLGILGILATMCAVMAITCIAVVQQEENRGHSEAMLATATGRTTLLASHLIWALIVPCLVLIGVAAGLPLTQAITAGSAQLLVDYAKAGVAMIPGLILIVGIALVLLGWAPRLFALNWAVLGWTIFCTWFAVLFDLPQWLVKIEPWGHLTIPPRDQMDWLPFFTELAIGLVLIGIGLVGYRRRDIVGG